MKTIYIMFLVSLLFVNAYSQKMTAKELAGLKGNVKSVITEINITKLDNEMLDSDTRTIESEVYYDQMGNLMKNPKKPVSNYKITYIYDNQGRITEERKSDLKGVQFFKTVFKYSSTGQVTETVYYAGKNISANNYLTYDNKGNLIEEKLVPTPFNMAKETVMQYFSDYQFDAQGNWIKRTFTTKSREAGRDSENQTIYYRKIEYYK